MSREEAQQTIGVVQEAARRMGSREVSSLTEALAGAPSYAVSLVAAAAGVMETMLPIWEEGKAREAIVAVLKDLGRDIARSVEAMGRPDNLEEIMRGRPSGCVYVPTDLLRAMWRLGDAVTKDEPAGMESARASEIAAKWVEERKAAWGKGSETELVNVRPSEETPF